jgi:hypothetical protein
MASSALKPFASPMRLGRLFCLAMIPWSQVPVPRNERRQVDLDVIDAFLDRLHRVLPAEPAIDTEPPALIQRLAKSRDHHGMLP